MANFVKYMANNGKHDAPSISHTIQTLPIGGNFQFGVYGASGLKVGPNDPSYGAPVPRPPIAGSTNDITWFDFTPLKAGNVLIDVVNPLDNGVWDRLQLAITSNPLYYIYHGSFDKDKFIDNFTTDFASNPRFDSTMASNALVLLKLMEDDNLILDIRWMAYMLATVFWETTSPRFKDVPVIDQRTHRPKLNADGDPVTRRVLIDWKMTMNPVDEFGHGAKRSYHMPVKVKLLPDGSARVTENDGDQWLVSVDGKQVALTRKPHMGATDGAAASRVFTLDDGNPQSYFGRGYVQLTWWANYAAAGVAIGRGLDLLVDPDLSKQPAIAYALMAFGMRTGKGFANGHKFITYFRGDHTDYKSARHMVNGLDHAQEIANIAKSFEKILLSSKP